MPKLGMEPIRKAALVKATILEIGRLRSLDVTVTQIAKRAGMSSALAHHYFGSKDEIFLAAMRHILTIYAAEVRGTLMISKTARGRLEAILRMSFSARNFYGKSISAPKVKAMTVALSLARGRSACTRFELSRRW